MPVSMAQCMGCNRTMVKVGLGSKANLTVENGGNLIDSASSHMLISNIKPCMSKYKSVTLKLQTAHYISYSSFVPYYTDKVIDFV